MDRPRHLFEPEGLAALARVLGQRALLAFDFDGTLAPLMARPEQARVAPEVAARLQALAARLPVAIVTGRALADVQGRLGFVPWAIAGNHGAEDGLDPEGLARLGRALDGWRRRLQAWAPRLEAAGVEVEDKVASLALHTRNAPDGAAARALLARLVEEEDPAARAFGGKEVLNVVPARAPDKAQAVAALVGRSGAEVALFAGDDLNDEPVFASAPPGWLTVRVGLDAGPSLARFHLEGPREVPAWLDRMLGFLGAEVAH